MMAAPCHAGTKRAITSPSSTFISPPKCPTSEESSSGKPSKIKSAKKLCLRFLRDFHRITDVIEVSVGDADHIRAIQFFQLFFSFLEQWVFQPGIDQENFSRRRLQFESRVTEVGELSGCHGHHETEKT